MNKMTAPLRIGVVGLGFGQQAHVPGFRSDDRCEVVAICGSERSRAKRVADSLGIAKAYGDWRELVADPDVDVISIAVPPVLQATIAIEAARAGKAVFCEKPLAANLADAKRMCQAVTDHQVAHAIDFLFPESEAFRFAKSEISAGRLGEVRHALVSWKVETYAVRNRLDSWKLRGDSGGGTLMSFVSHSFYYLEWLLGPIVAIQGSLYPAGSTDDLRVNAWIDHASGCQTVLTVATDACLGSGHRIEIYGSEGALVLDNRGADYVSGFGLSVGDRVSGQLQTVSLREMAPGTDGRVDALSGIIGRFVDAIVDKGVVKPSFFDGLRVQQLIEAVRQSDRSGERRRVGDK